MEMQWIKPYINGHYVDSKSTKSMDVYNPSTGAVIARVQCCTRDWSDQAKAIGLDGIDISVAIIILG